MSRRNDAVNRIAQGSTLFTQHLNAYQRKVLVALLKRAYELGARDNEKGD